MAKPAIYDIQTLIQAGIDPKSGLPIRLGEYSSGKYQADIKILERIKDEQIAVNRYKWDFIPFDLTSQEIERLLYYKGQLCIVWDNISEKFYLMPYALDGGIDFYGRYVTVHPVPMADGAGSTEEKKMFDRLRSYLSTLKLRVLYDIPEEILEGGEKLEQFDPTKCTVILRDYTPQLGQTIIPRANLMDSLLDIKANCIPFMNTSLLNSTGVLGMRVQNQDEANNVMAANQSLKSAALKGQRYIPVVGQIEFQEMTGDSALRSQEFMLALQALENYQKGIYGLDGNGVMQKAAHTLESEQQMNMATSSSPLEDGLKWRQYFCDIVNLIFGTEMTVAISEIGMGADMNMDGLVGNEQDQASASEGAENNG